MIKDSGERRVLRPVWRATPATPPTPKAGVTTDKHTTTELAYKQGYEKGYADAKEEEAVKE